MRVAVIMLIWHLIGVPTWCTPMRIERIDECTKCEDKIRQVNATWARSILTADFKTYAELLDGDYVGIDPFGNSATKAEDIASLKMIGVIYENFDAGEDNIRIYGDTAILTGTLTAKLRGLGSKATYKYSAAYIRQNDSWRIILVQAIPMLSLPRPSVIAKSAANYVGAKALSIY